MAFDVRKQVFVSGDADTRSSTLPFEFKSASYIDVAESADGVFVRFDMAVPSNSDQVACGNCHYTCREQNNRNLLHSNFDSSVTMLRRVALDSMKFFMVGILLQYGM